MPNRDNCAYIDIRDTWDIGLHDIISHKSEPVLKAGEAQGELMLWPS